MGEPGEPPVRVIFCSATFDVDGAINHLGHLPADSPLVERDSGRVLALSFDYTW